MYLVAGSNLFNQWFCNDSFFSAFLNIRLKPNCNIDFTHAELVDINWSYNIFKIKNVFYITGAWDGAENVKQVMLPNDCHHQDLTIVGNEYNLVLASKKDSLLWVSKFDSRIKFKKMSLSIETPLEHTDKKKRPGSISKLVSAQNNSLYMTDVGNVYCGILPSYIETEHCVGNVLDVDCGNEHFLLLTDAGRVYTWGNGRRLQLGHGDVTNLDIPSEVDALAGIKITKISAGGWHSLALSEFGDVYAWGWNDQGQLGIEENGEKFNNFALPTLVELIDNKEEVHLNVKDIACGSRHSAILLEDNSVWTTGLNKYGQLGFSPVEKPFVNNFHKAYQCDTNSRLMCGPWTTVIVSE